MLRQIADAMFDFLQNNPSVAAGTCTFTVAFALVAGNAFYAQSGSHPDPIWSTRDAVNTRSISSEPIVRPVRTTTIKPREIPVPTSRTQAAVEAEQKKIVSDIQTALLKTGDFAGEVDGRQGPVTRRAIETYQRRNALTVDGQADAKLLEHILNDLPIAKVGRSDNLTAIIAKDETPVASSRSDYDRKTIEEVQKALAAAGYGDLTVDGIYGNQTRDAISQFQKRHNLKVTGKPDDELLEKLSAG